ncbi:DUF4352 domain-containing protein [Clostridium swellfunianum]|uniref:DUF4352 domain-containing protein n=1 Tax=Clostridium swellfunianum TaxID=1367462 RepID=UPI00202FB1AB|nr:DUF4352 domain-containing protein [Clostridium swellfunianum]MCM0647340.1 DUF4352 domain-containing protein [Clostridium swellfunianum]
MKFKLGIILILSFLLFGCGNSNLTSEQKGILSAKFNKLSPHELGMFEDMVRKKDLTESDKKRLKSYVDSNFSNDEVLKKDYYAIIDGTKASSNTQKNSDTPKQPENSKATTPTDQSEDNYKKGVEAYKNQQYDKAIEYLGKVSASSKYASEAYNVASEAYKKMPITNDTIKNKGQFFLNKWNIVDVINYRLNSVQAYTSLNGHNAAEGRVFLVLDISVKNMSGQGKPADGYGDAKNINIDAKTTFRLYDRDKHIYMNTQIESHSLNGKLSSGSEVRGEVVYEIPISIGSYYLDTMMGDYKHTLGLVLK